MNAATRAVIERLVEALVPFCDEGEDQPSLNSNQLDAVLAEARALLEEPASEDAWLAAMLSEAKEREARLRAHIQEAADDAQSNEMAAAVNGETYQVTYFKKLRDWHLAALEQNNG